MPGGHIALEITLHTPVAMEKVCGSLSVSGGRRKVGACTISRSSSKRQGTGGERSVPCHMLWSSNLWLADGTLHRRGPRK